MSQKIQHTTKERILDAAEGLMLEKSFHSVGLNELLASVKVPKGSFYHHFESKEHFGIELLRHYLSKSHDFKKKWLEDRIQFPDARERLVLFFNAGMAKFLENGCKPICLVVKLAGEVATFSDGMREELMAGFSKWEKLLADTIREGQRQRSIATQLDVPLIVSLISSTWLGAMLRAQVVENVGPMRQAIAYIEGALAP